MPERFQHADFYRNEGNGYVLEYIGERWDPNYYGEGWAKLWKANPDGSKGELIYEIINKIVPTEALYSRKFYKPWLTYGLLLDLKNFTIEFAYSKGKQKIIQLYQGREVETRNTWQAFSLGVGWKF